MTTPDTFNQAMWIAGLAWEAKPKYIHRLQGSDRFEARQAAQAREAAIRAYREQRTNFAPAVASAIAHTTHLPTFFDQFFHVSTHHQLKGRKMLPLARDEFKETRLGHKRNIGKFD